MNIATRDTLVSHYASQFNVHKDDVIGRSSPKNDAANTARQRVYAGLWVMGLSTSAIGSLMGRTRQSVLSGLRRQGLEQDY